MAGMMMMHGLRRCAKAGRRVLCFTKLANLRQIHSSPSSPPLSCFPVRFLFDSTSLILLPFPGNGCPIPIFTDTGFNLGLTQQNRERDPLGKKS